MRHNEGKTTSPDGRPPITVHYPGSSGLEKKTFDAPFRIGRDEECDVQISSPSVSRVHAEVTFENGDWWLIDLHSSNGTFHAGKKVDRVRISSDEALSFSKNGPEIRLTTGRVSGTVIPPENVDFERPGQFERTLRDDAGPVERPKEASSSPSRPQQDLSLEEYVEHYLSADSSQPAGEHTIMIRRAFQSVQKKQQKHHFATIGAVVGVALVIAIVSVVFIYRAEKQRERAEQQAVAVFNRIKELDIQIKAVKSAALASGSAPLLAELRRTEEIQQQLNAEYDQYVTEFGIRRRLNEKERSIYAMARVFNETEIEIPPGFVKEVNRTINSFWLRTGRGKFIDGIKRAEQLGYTPAIVNTLKSYGLPPEFFYLAMQESDFNVNAVGWETRWGFAKGMWQFIPATAERYGLKVGPLKDSKTPDPLDDRHNFERSTNAAARYLSEIYTTLAQASGLLVIASYNWGEHRIVSKLERLPDPEAFQGMGRNPDERNYWRFYKEYGNRMPEETKDYVLKIFSAAVIGSNPGLFGFEFDDPLAKYR